MMGKQFIDFTEVKGETWFSADDILICLGYVPNALNKVDLLRNNRTNQKSGKVFNIQPRKFIDNNVWWNETSILRFKQYLQNTPRVKNRLYKWDEMEKVRKSSMNSVLSLEGKVKDFESGLVNENIDYIKIYQDKKNFKDFIKELRKQGVVLKGQTNSWNALKINHPEIYTKVESAFTNKTKHLVEGKDKYRKDNYSNTPSVNDNYCCTEYNYKVKTLIKKGLFGINKEMSTELFTDVEDFVDFVVSNAEKIVEVEKVVKK